MNNCEQRHDRAIAQLAPVIQQWHSQGRYHYWSHGDCCVFYRDIGDPHASADHTLMLLHGFPESSFVFHKVVEGLKARFSRLILVDLPGFGLSDKPRTLSYSLFEQTDALLSVWRALKVKGGHLIAHDMGDSVLTELVARSELGMLPSWFESGLRSITFTNGNMVMEKAKLVPIQKLLRQHTLGPVINRLTNARLFKKQVLSAHGTHMQAEDLEHLWQLSSFNEGHKLAWKIIRYLDERDKFQRPRWLNALAKYPGPIHICWGAKDQVAPVEVAQHLKQQVCPQANLTLLPRVGHFCETQAPNEWLEAILAFYRPSM